MQFKRSRRDPNVGLHLGAAAPRICRPLRNRHVRQGIGGSAADGNPDPSPHRPSMGRGRAYITLQHRPHVQRGNCLVVLPQVPVIGILLLAKWVIFLILLYLCGERAKIIPYELSGSPIIRQIIIFRTLCFSPFIRVLEILNPF